MDLRLVEKRFAAFPSFRLSEGCGIISASDGNQFQGLQLLTLSLRRLAPFVVFDLGMTAEQQAWCVQQGIQLARPHILMPPSVLMWQTWNKPFYLRASPFPSTLWLDTDCLLVGDPRPIFQALAGTGFLCVKHRNPKYAIPWHNSERLYQKLPVRRRLGDLCLNAGVVGVARGCPLLQKYAALVEMATLDPELRGWLAYWDEGALRWAVEAADRHDVIFPNPKWNRMIWEREPAWRTLEGFLETLDPAGDVIHHYTDRPKLWANWQ
jgi:hypothetical protein